MNNDILQRLRAPKDLDGKSTRMPSALELEAAGVIESMEFQLAARIGVERAKLAEVVGAAS